MKKLIAILIVTCFFVQGFSQTTITYSFLPQVNNGDGTQTLTVTATASANVASGSWSAGRMGFRLPLSATGASAATYGQNFGATGGNPDANFTNVTFNNNAPGGFSDPVAGTSGITTFLLEDVGGVNDGFLYIGFNWTAPANSALTGGNPVTVLSFRVPSSWSCAQCFQFISNPAMDQLGSALTAQFDISIQQSNVVGGTFNMAIAGTNGSLPVHFSKYDVRCNDKGALLTWSTAWEQNSKNFEVQRSKNGVDWTVVGTVPAAGNSADNRDYSFIDLGSSGQYQYRVRQVDLDNRYTYTEVRSTNCSTPKFAMALYPVPADDKLNVVVKSDIDLATQFKVVDIAGRVVNIMNVQLNKGSTNIVVPTFKLPAGQYVIVCNDPAVQINSKFTVAH